MYFGGQAACTRQIYVWLFSRWFSFCSGFISVNFASRTSQILPLQVMSIYSNENIRKIMKLSPHKFLHLVQNRENYGVYIQYTVTVIHENCDWKTPPDHD